MKYLIRSSSQYHEISHQLVNTKVCVYIIISTWQGFRQGVGQFQNLTDVRRVMLYFAAVVMKEYLTGMDRSACAFKFILSCFF